MVLYHFYTILDGFYPLGAPGPTPQKKKGGALGGTGPATPPPPPRPPGAAKNRNQVQRLRR